MKKLFKKYKLGYLFPLFLFLALIVFLWKGMALDPKVLPSTLIGKPMPAFQLQTLDDPQITVNESLVKGRVTILNIWATWCYSCKGEHSLLVELSKNNKLIQWVGINLHDDLKMAEAWLKQQGDPYQVSLIDPKGKLAIDLGITGTPSLFIVDKKGIIRYKHVGLINIEIWTQKLLPLIIELQGGKKNE